MGLRFWVEPQVLVADKPGERVTLLGSKLEILSKRLLVAPESKSDVFFVELQSFDCFVLFRHFDHEFADAIFVNS